MVENTAAELDRAADGAPIAVPEDAPLVEDVLLVEDDLLVEDVSIDGMCGVY
jgi:mycofactocin precursor